MESDQRAKAEPRQTVREYLISGIKLAAVSVDITPVDPIPLAGYLRSSSWASVGERLEGNFLIFFGNDDLFILGSIDTLFIEHEIVEAVAGRLGINSSHIFLVASHTHNAPSLSQSTPLLGKFCRDYEAMVTERICQALAQAMRDGGLNSEFSFGAVEGNYNINRRKPAFVADYTAVKKGRLPRVGRGIALSENPDGVVDRNIYTLPVFMEGKVRAVVWSLAAHPAFYPDYNAVSSDFPGTVRRLLRETFGEDVAVLFFPGLAGSAIPRMSRIFPKTIKQFILLCLPFQQRMRSFSRRTYLDYCSRISEQIISLIDGTVSRNRLSECKFSRASEIDIFRMESGDLVPLHASRIELNGKLSLLFLSGEVVGEWGDLLRQGKDQILTGYAPGRPIYIPIAAQLPEGGYEVDRFKAHFSLRGNFLSDYQDAVITTVKRLDSSP